METKDFKKIFASFIGKIKELNNPSFTNVENWHLLEDLLNGVLIGYTISNLTDRKLLHETGQQYGLIPLCPDEVVDLEGSGPIESKRAIVITRFGKLPIEPNRKQLDNEA